MSRSSRNQKIACVFGCDGYHGVYMHNFPHPERNPKLLSTWLSIVGERLKEKDLMKVYKNKKVCDHHFKPEHKTSGHRLMFSTVPTLYLDGFYKHNDTSIAIQAEHNYCFPRMAAPGESAPNDCIGGDLESQYMPQEPLEIDRTPVTAPLFTWQGFDHVKFDGVVVIDEKEKKLGAPPGTNSRDAVDLSMCCDDIEGESKYYSDNVNIKRDIKSGDRSVHEGYECNECNGSIIGFRYTCVQCADYDLCATCEARGSHASHYVLRVPGPRPYAEVKSVLDSIRLKLQAQKSVAIAEPGSIDIMDDLLDDVKIEFIEEDVDDFRSIAETDTTSDPEDPLNSVLLCPEVKEKTDEMQKTETQKLHKKPFRRKYPDESQAKVVELIGGDPTDPLHIKPTKELSNDVTKGVSKTSHTRPTTVYVLKQVTRKRSNAKVLKMS